MADHSNPKDRKRFENLHRLKRIINGSFKKFGNHRNCECKFEVVSDPRTNESIGDARVCSFCEWACCGECIVKSNLSVECVKCNI